MRFLSAGRQTTGQQGTQRRTTGKSQPASTYRTAATSQSGGTNLTNDWAADKDARDKKHKTGKYAPAPRMFK